MKTVRIPRQIRGNISHISHLGEYRTAHRQWVSEASKGLQLTLESSELVAIEQRKDKLSEKCGKITRICTTAGRRASCRRSSGVPFLTTSSSLSR